MSTDKRHQNWCIRGTKIIFENNKDLTETMLFLLKKQYPKNTFKLISKNIDISFYTVRNWFQKRTGLNAYEFWLMIKKCDFIRIYLGIKQTLNRAYFKNSEENREEIIKNIIFLLKKDSSLTAKEISKELVVKQKTIEYLFKKLRKEHKIKHTGSNKKGAWIVLK